MRIIPISQQARGAFNNGQIIENKPIGFPQDGGFVRPYSSLFYWARAEAMVDSTIGVHPHKGFEIMSFVLEGNIRHFDSKLNDWKPLQAGDVQIIRAGNGISHAEHIEKGGVIFQIWLDPDLSKTLYKDASYDDYRSDSFKREQLDGTVITYYAGDLGIMSFDTPGIDIRRVSTGQNDFHWNGQPEKLRSLYVIDGSGTINGKTIEKDDFIILENGEDIVMQSHESLLDVFILSGPIDPGYKTYA